MAKNMANCSAKSKQLPGRLGRAAAAEAQQSGIQMKPEVGIQLFGFKHEPGTEVARVHAVAGTDRARQNVNLN